MSQSQSHCLNICHTISTCTWLKYIPRNNNLLILFGSSTFTSCTFPKNWTFQEMSHMPQHNHGLCQDNHNDLCQDHHTICWDNHHDLYKKITNIYAMITIIVHQQLCQYHHQVCQEISTRTCTNFIPFQDTNIDPSAWEAWP